MYKTNFKGKSVNAYAKRNVLTISNFAGVDYTDSALNVPSNHALDILNLYLKDNVIQKRSGLKHLFSLESGKKVHKVYEFNNSLIVHIGTHLFVLNKDNFDIVKSFTDKDYLLDKEVTFIEKNDKLFILGGIKYFYLDKDFNMFNAEDYSYIPTTTIGIVNSFVPSGDIQNEDTNRTNLDKVNNLSSLVINELISGVRLNSDTKLVDYNMITKYQLDNKIDLSNYDKISINIDNAKLEESKARVNFSLKSFAVPSDKDEELTFTGSVSVYGSLTSTMIQTFELVSTEYNSSALKVEFATDGSSYSITVNPQDILNESEDIIINYKLGETPYKYTIRVYKLDLPSNKNLVYRIFGPTSFYNCLHKQTTIGNSYIAIPTTFTLIAEDKYYLLGAVPTNLVWKIYEVNNEVETEINNEDIEFTYNGISATFRCSKPYEAKLRIKVFQNEQVIVTIDTESKGARAF